jgi:RNA polymerase sigma factor (TIGR02999 family)
MLPGMSEVTRILDAAAAGDPRAAADLLPLVYDELRRLADIHMAREKPGQTLTATALVHEAYLRLVPDRRGQPGGSPDFANRRHFFAAAATAMRRILVENARRKRSAKHGGGLIRRDLDDACLALPEPREDLLALDEALDKLAAKDNAKAELVQLRYFAGLTLEQAAEALGISTTTADRYWAYARAWLHQEMTREGDTAG